MSGPWNGWYPCIGGTYGTWPYGDPRGFRTRHHREHVEGDYRHPPPEGTYDELLDRSLHAMRGGEVVLSKEQRPRVCRAMGERLRREGAELVDLCVDATHFHALCRFPNWGNPAYAAPGLNSSALSDGRDPVPRHLVGLAKKHAAMTLLDLGLKPAPGPLWAKRSHVIPIEDESHWHATAAYIRDHAQQGASLWSGLPATA